ncbi:helix-turn-helix domain-containing protein [Saccharopolyspora rosea]|uniref:helix-turn-helix domain-containing protein n=1 Tax=Saccharopolyspora rosea TaxID=524884 RepID=UPI0021D83D4B|nr:helix-turn-helix transcriptional regulator [Saccharopolyspora rosea]
MSSAGDEGAVLRAARTEAGISLAKMASLTNYSKPYLGLVETGKRTVTVDLVIAYENGLGPIGDDMLRRRDITHPRVLKARRPTLTELARSIDDGDPGALRNTPSSRTVDFFLASKLSPSGVDHVRRWVRSGQTSTLRANALAVLSKMSIASDVPLIIEALENDDKLRFLSLASEVSKLTQWDWNLCKTIVREPSAAPQPRKLAKALTKEALLDSDAESRWCGAYLLKELVPVLGR